MSHDEMSEISYRYEDLKSRMRKGLDFLERFVDKKAGTVNVTKLREYVEKLESDNAALRKALENDDGR